MYSIKQLREIIDSAIIRESKIFMESSPVNLYIPVKYTLAMGGKRLRPVMLLLSYNLFSKDITNAIPAAIAIEIFHNFTLLHDDIMDNANMRRNQTTVHKKFNNNAAILSGDVMSFLSFQYLLQGNTKKQKEIFQIFSDTAIQVCEGQQYDMDFENKTDVNETDYLKMIRLKTAVLIGCSLKIGALLANMPNDISNNLYEYGINLGMAFQLQDDFLDSFGNEKVFGKRIGGDIISNKKTFLFIKAFNLATKSHKNELIKWFSPGDFNPETKINTIISIYKELNIDKITQEKISSYFESASNILQELPLDNHKKEQLQSLSLSMLKRLY